MTDFWQPEIVGTGVSDRAESKSGFLLTLPVHGRLGSSSFFQNSQYSLKTGAEIVNQILHFHSKHLPRLSGPPSVF